MNFSGSGDQYYSSSSGCESGWTMYLDQSSSYFSKNQCSRFDQDWPRASLGDVDDSEEDLSMVSDASSGPPHYFEDDEHDYCFGQFNDKRSNAKNKTKQKCYFTGQVHCSALDDTASSPVFTKTKKANKKETSKGGVTEFSQGFSATHFKEKSTLRKHFGFLQSSVPEKSAPNEQGWFQERKWK